MKAAPQTGPVFEPCAATGSLFLYAQDSSIVCIRHETLSIERRFQKHKQNVSLIVADNISDRGAGSLIASYDNSQTAIVWDVTTGDEVASFYAYEPINVAAWLKNGNVAYGMSSSLNASESNG
jgi:WD40 repeat protein